MGALLRSFSGHMNSVYAVDFSPDGKSVRAPFRGWLALRRKVESALAALRLIGCADRKRCSRPHHSAVGLAGRSYNRLQRTVVNASSGWPVRALCFRLSCRQASRSH